MPFLTIYKKKKRGLELEQAEGRIGSMLPRTYFPNISAAQRALNKIPKPELGYNKFDVFIRGKRLRYDHGKNDSDLRTQLDYYKKRRM